MLADFVTLDSSAGLWREMTPAYVVYGMRGRDVSNVVVGGVTVVSK
jgi:cytosine/adenosine deaminase-related metal-dependent hydrolase